MARKRCLTISFKNTSKDLRLYNLVNNMEDRSNEIKRALYSFYFENQLNDDKKIRMNLHRKKSSRKVQM